jgi:hypothetical protein
MSQPDLSIIVPTFNRGTLIRHTLESVQRASSGLTVETIIIDDGSSPPAADSIAQLSYKPEKIIRQENRGLLFARLTGLSSAQGRHVLFLDSDDLVSPEKLRLQVSVMDQQNVDVSYTDAAQCTITGDYDSLRPISDQPLPSTAESAEFFIAIQPPPHSPIFRTDYLKQIVADAPFPPSPLYNPVAEIWFYHIAACRPARVVHVPGPHAIIGSHPGARLTNHWEKLGVASLAVQEAFARTCPPGPQSAYARQLVAEKAFAAWRRLPRNFSPEFRSRQLNLWRRLHGKSCPAKLGGRSFAQIARILGPIAAGKLFRAFQATDYARIRTLDDAAFSQLLSALPSP